MVVVLTAPASGISLGGYFSDDNGHLFENDIDAIAAAGITKGCNPPANTRFCPDRDVARGAMAAFLRRALNLPSSSTDYFTDDDNSIFEGDINAIAAAGITKGCNPPANTRFCPDQDVDRGAMAAFLRRALNLPSSSTDYFTDDDNSVFESDINAIAAADITRGCNPPSNSLYCPRRDVSRGAMAAFLKRGLGVPYVVQRIPAGFHSAMSCSKDGERCSLTVDVSAGRPYEVEEGVFQVTPASQGEQQDLTGSSTQFTLSLDGAAVPLTEQPTNSGGGLSSRTWSKTMSFSPGNHTLVARWNWAGQPIQTNTITIRAAS
jgi:hypothetical protein